MQLYEISVSPQFMAGMMIFYLTSIFALKHYMHDKNACHLKNVMQVYNVLQIALNIYIIYGLRHFSTLQNIFGLNTQYSHVLERFVYLHYLSKYLDFLDTFFIILRKKRGQLSFLHVYHHATIGLIWGGLLYVGHGNGTAAFGALMNCVIHAIMYSHDFWTTLGYNNPYKKLITQAQLLQFALCILNSVCVLIWETVYPPKIAWVQYIYHIQMITLFRSFYQKSYDTRRMRVTQITSGTRS
jgi:elongation of very long chain fatty acids protein 4